MIVWKLSAGCATWRVGGECGCGHLSDATTGVVSPSGHEGQNHGHTLVLEVEEGEQGDVGAPDTTDQVQRGHSSELEPHST